MRLTKTTKRRFLIVLGLGILLIGGGLGWYGVRRHRIQAQFMAWRDEGMQAAKQSENDKAVELLGNYLRRYPDDVEVLVEYARVRPLVKSPQRQHLRDTMTVLRHLLALSPDKYEQRKTLLKLYADYGYGSEAVVTAEELLGTNPADSEVQGIKATTLGRMREVVKALAEARRWVELSPRDVDAQLLLVEVMRDNARPKDEIIATADKLESTLQTEASFELVRGVAAAVTGDAGEAKTWILKAADSVEGDLKLERKIVAVLDRLGETDKSLELLKMLVKETGDPEGQKALVRRLWERTKWTEVLTYPIAKTSELASDAELKGMIGTALARTGKVEEAKRTAAELTGTRQDLVGVAWGELLTQIVSPESKGSRKVVDACQAALKESPNDPCIRYFLGQGYAGMGESDLAASNYQAAAQLSDTWATPLISLAEVYLASDRLEEALFAAGAAFTRSKEQAAVTLTIALNASIEAGKRPESDALRQLLDGIEKGSDGGSYVLPERAAWLIRANKAAEATALIKKALDAPTPPDETVLRRLAKVSRTHKLSVENACYEALERRNGVTAQSVFAKAIGILLAGKTEDAVAYFRDAQQKAAAGEKRDWQLAIARLLDLAGDARALPEWIKLGDGYADDIQVQQTVLSARASRGDRDFMKRSIDRVKQLSANDGVQWRIAEARWMLDDPANSRSRAEAASVLLTEALRAAPDAIEGRFLQAKALARQGNTSAAIEQVRNILRINPSMTGALLYAASLLQGRGDFSGAQEYLDRIDRNELRDSASKHMAAQMLNQQGDTEGAIKLLAPNPGMDAEPDLMLAILYRKQNKLDRAEEMCRKLLQKPDVQSVALAMDVYSAMGRPDEAQKASQLLKGLKLDPGIEELLLADFAARSGKPQEALALSRLAVQKAPQNASAWKALFINCLANDKGLDAWSALDLGLKAVPQDAYLLALADAKAQILAGLANRRLQILTLSLIRNPQDAGGTKEVIDLMRDQGAERPSDQKMGRLLQVTSRYPLNLPIQLYAIAELWERDMDEAVGMAIRTAQSFPQSVEAVRLAATACISAKRWNEAASFAKAWRERSPEDALRADLLGATANLKMERSAAAKALLAPYVSTEVLAQPDKNPELITLYAVALQQSGATSEAEKLILPLIKSSETIRNAWLFQTAQYLSQGDQLKWLTRVSEVSAENSVMGQLQLAGAKAALGQKSKDPELLATARKMRARIMEQKDLTVPVMAVLASQCEQDGDLEGAEKLYRRILAIDPGLAVIKNNLAMVMINRGGSLEEAAKLAQEAVGSSPSTPNYYDTLAQAQAKAGKVDDAIKNLRIASQVDPSHLDWLINLTILLADANRKKEAHEVLGQIDADTVRKGKLSEELKYRLTTVRKRVTDSGAVPAAAGS